MLQAALVQVFPLCGATGKVCNSVIKVVISFVLFLHGNLLQLLIGRTQSCYTKAVSVQLENPKAQNT